MAKYILYTDGAARGNPGPAGAGCHIENEDGETIASVSEYLGTTTNNQSEYKALIFGLEKVLALASQDEDPPVIECRMDSELIVEQMNQNYKVKHPELKTLYASVREIIISLGGAVTFKHVPREKNKKADKLANEAIDNTW